MRLSLYRGLCAALCGLFLMSCSDGKSNEDPAAAIDRRPPSETTILLPTRPTNVRHGTITVSASGIRLRAQVEYWNGYRETVLLRPDRTVKEQWQYFPDTSDATAWKLRSHATFEPDGRTYSSHEIYNRKGQLERSGFKRGTDGNYESSFYYPNGAEISRTRIFSPGRHRRILQEKLFRPDGSIEVAIRYLDGGAKSFTLYHPNGKMKAIVQRAPGGFESGTVLADDGSTTVFEYSHELWTMQEEFYNAQGINTQSRSASFGKLTIGFVSADGTRIFKQSWRQGYLSNEASSKLLRKVEEFDATTRKLIRSATMSKDGEYVESVDRMVDGIGLVNEQLDRDGNVISFTIKGSAAVQKPAGGAAYKHVFSAESLTEPEKPTAPPAYEEAAAPPVVYEVPSDEMNSWKP